MIPIEQTVQNFHLLLSTWCDAKNKANFGAFFMCNLDLAWADATDSDTNNGSLDSRGDGVRVLRSGTVGFG